MWPVLALTGKCWLLVVVNVLLLGTVLEDLGPFLASLGGVLMRLGNILGRLWGVLEACWGVLGASWRGGGARVERGFDILDWLRGIFEAFSGLGLIFD